MQGELLTFLSYTKLMLAGNAYDAIYYKSSVNILTNLLFLFNKKVVCHGDYRSIFLYILICIFLFVQVLFK